MDQSLASRGSFRRAKTDQAQLPAAQNLHQSRRTRVVICVLVGSLKEVPDVVVRLGACVRRLAHGNAGSGTSRAAVSRRNTFQSPMKRRSRFSPNLLFGVSVRIEIEPEAIPNTLSRRRLHVSRREQFSSRDPLSRTSGR